MNTKMMAYYHVLRVLALFFLLLPFSLAACGDEDEGVVKEATAVAILSPTTIPEPTMAEIVVDNEGPVTKPENTTIAITPASIMSEPEATETVVTKETTAPEPTITATAQNDEENILDTPEPESWRPFRTLGVNATYGVDISPDGTIALLGGEGFISIVNLNDLTSQQIFIGDGPIKQILFSPDNQYILIAYEFGPPILLDRLTGNLVQSFETLDYSPIALSPDGTKIAGRRDNKFVEIWDIGSHELLTTLTGHAFRIDDLDFSPDGTLIASASADRTARVWDVATGEEINQFDHYNDVSAVAYAPNGQYLATHNKLWNTVTGEEIDTSNLFWEGDFVVFSPDSQKLAAVASTGRATLINVSPWESIDSLEGSNQHNQAVFSPDGRHLLLGSNLWDINSGEVTAALGGHSHNILATALSADGKFAATGSLDQTVILWNLDTGATVHTLSGDNDSFKAVALSPDGMYLLANDGDDIRMWETATGSELLTIHYAFGWDERRPVGFLPDGSQFFTTDEDGNLILYDVTSGGILQSFDHSGAGVYTASFTPDAQMAVTGSEGRDSKFIRLWNVESGQLLWEHGLVDAGRIETVAFSPDGTQIISLENGFRGGDPSILRVWDTSTGQEINTIVLEDFSRSAAYFPDGRQALVGGPEGAIIIDIATGQKAESIVGSSSIYFNDIEYVAVSANGERILLGASKLPLIFEKSPFSPLTND